ncbi:Gp93 [Mycolicibacterium canariasense]|uniref:Gp93 n=1 Tax=Mycolicibacterium canariasense TaxID=228230 RepID=A0A117IAW9_MYCCR|nr:hypothetical protein [Mycolicibacterium canariasense]MCV7211553.1 hypothetical protein [Mycolicibacterium canariasense]ORV00357.1 hypothetical protein AWB94_26795 [Mycolicibacterium canariasense]GAS97040.1 Gp93 [Mycolicibacterium canariasense]
MVPTVVRSHAQAFRTAVKFYKMSLMAQRQRAAWRAKHGDVSIVYHESESAVLEDRELYNATLTGLAEFAAGQRVSSDWLFDEDEGSEPMFDEEEE